MPGKRKRKAGPKFHPSFKPPTTAERNAALGEFPGAVHTNSSRASMISNEYQRNNESEFVPVEEAITDLNKQRLYVPVGRSETKYKIPPPRNEQDWLATVPEEGQTFDDYIRFLTSRSGRIRPIANAGCSDIILLPLVRRTEEKENLVWPAHGPPLEYLASLTRAYFNRPVKVFPPAYVSESHKKLSKTRPGAFTTAVKFQGSLYFPKSDNSGHATSHRSIPGRRDAKTGRVQLQVDPLLNELSEFREGRITATVSSHDADECATLAANFCVMGITMEDLYESPSDLFIAGFAFGGSKVALFSFARYHTHLKMHPGEWHGYGYGAVMDEYSYYEDHDQNPKHLSHVPPSYASLDSKSSSELLRRCGKLLVHELGHLYGLGHCIFNRCIMMGTGHLVEDFAAPFHLCPVCLRKLQWRLGFKVAERYKRLGNVFAEELGLEKEAAWVHAQASALSDGSDGTEQCSETCSKQVIDLTSP